MKFTTEDENDICWMRDPSGYEAEDTIRQIKDAGKWQELLESQQDENGEVDVEALYDFLRHSSDEALLLVGLHNNEGTASVKDVLEAWEAAHKDEGLRLSRDSDGNPSGVSLFNYGGRLGTSLDFESVNADGEVEDVSLDDDEVLELVNFKANNNADTGRWDCTDVDKADFEMWRENT